MGKLFALAIIAETPIGCIALTQRCDREFDDCRKGCAHQFKPVKNDESEEDDLDEDEAVSSLQEDEPIHVKVT
jgi:hypothetical protein